MIDYNAYHRKIVSLMDAENRSEKAADAMAQLSVEILHQIIQLTNGFSIIEAPALVAALDRYKAILLDTVDHDRKKHPGGCRRNQPAYHGGLRLHQGEEESGC